MHYIGIINNTFASFLMLLKEIDHSIELEIVVNLAVVTQDLFCHFS